MNNLFREALTAALQAIGWMIGTLVCGFVFTASHLFIWPILILITLFVLWRNPRFVSQRWEQLRRRIWEFVRKTYGYNHPSLIKIEAPRADTKPQE